jgi:hypothetical protein
MLVYSEIHVGHLWFHSNVANLQKIVLKVVIFVSLMTACWPGNCSSLFCVNLYSLVAENFLPSLQNHIPILLSVSIY